MGAMADLNERLISGFLDHVIDTRIVKRWAVLEKSADGDSLTLRLFRDDKEANEKNTYVLSKENFIGTERGSVRQHNKKSPARYWAIITIQNPTLLFQHSHNNGAKTVSIFEKWDKKVKDFWKHQSWLVKPLEGANSFTKEDGLTLHINWASVCLAYLNPPRHYLRWCLDTIQHISYENTKLCFNVMKDNNNSGYYEVKAEKERFAAKIKEVVENLRSRYLGQSYICPNDNQKVPPDGSTSVCSDPTTMTSSSCKSEWTSQNMPADQTPSENMYTYHPHLRLPGETCRCEEAPTCKLETQKGDCGTAMRKMSDPKFLSVPAIKIVPVSPETDSRREFEFRHKQSPCIPPRTTSYVLPGQGNPTWTESKAGTRMKKGMSASTSILHEIHSEQVFEPSRDSPTSTGGRALPPIPKKPDCPEVTSAVQLPLPKPPVTLISPGNMEKASRVMKPTDDCDSCGGSMTSILSQTSDVTSMDMTQSLSSLSSEEERGRCSSVESRKTSPTRTSVQSLTGFSHPSSDTKTPTYIRSHSVPAELPKTHSGFTELVEPEYMSTESLKEGYLHVRRMESCSAESEYINLPSEQSLYVNPGLTLPPNPLPLPPRTKPPAHPGSTRTDHFHSGSQSCESMELHEVLDAMLHVKEMGCSMGLPHGVLVKFCLMCDTEITFQNNWKGIAEQLGLTANEIFMVDDYCRRYSKKPTQVILAYWEKQAQPLRPFKMKELVSILHNMDRQDLLDVIIQREKQSAIK
ncbi:uncharacterized protein [Asterias amurensis]|uniref:uncharacterized protein n=1 Tax=Asterias amurensis TaxID=7602 RepID=UPI003AB652A6